MPGATTKITDREKAALFYFAAGLCDDWRQLYLIADAKTPEEAAENRNIKQYVSDWKRSEKVKKALEEFRKILADRDADERRKGAEQERQRKQEEKNAGDSNRTDAQPEAHKRKEIDYYNPEEQKKQINRIIQDSADDPKTQLDAIKTIQQTQRDDKQAAREGRQVRAYLPQRCNTCPLYEKARRKPTK